MIIKKFGEVHAITKLTEVFVGRCGSGHTVFGESAYFTRATKQHLVFTTESGTIVKTDYQLNAIGKAAKNNYFVSFVTIDKRDNVIPERVHYWNNEKMCMEYK